MPFLLQGSVPGTRGTIAFIYLFFSISLTKNPQMANSSPIKRTGVRHRDEPWGWRNGMDPCSTSFSLAFLCYHFYFLIPKCLLSQIWGPHLLESESQGWLEIHNSGSQRNWFCFCFFFFSRLSFGEGKHTAWWPLLASDTSCPVPAFPSTSWCHLWFFPGY